MRNINLVVKFLDLTVLQILWYYSSTWIRNDILWLNDGSETINSGDGNDKITVNGGTDNLITGNGNDTIIVPNYSSNLTISDFKSTDNFIFKTQVNDISTSGNTTHI